MAALDDLSTADKPRPPSVDAVLGAGHRSLSFAKVAGLCVATLLLGGGIGTTVQKARSERQATQSVAQPTNIDVGFLRDMMVHHEQALELSLIVMNRGIDSSVRQEAVDILLAQRGEYVQMGDQLDEWGVDALPENDTSMAWMGMAVPTAKMPGLATPEQITKLKSLQGTDADVEFLRLMINHHASGADMAQFAADRSQVPFVAVMAGRMAAVQTTEINEMRAFARRLGVEIAAPAPMDHSNHSSSGESSDKTSTDPTNDPSGDTTMVDHSNMDHG
jgi:uncharacterized protein (DUF305 family)